MAKLDQEFHFLLGPGFSSTSPYSNRNSDSKVIEILAIMQSSGVNGPRALDSYVKPNIENSYFYMPLHNSNRHKCQQKPL